MSDAIDDTELDQMYTKCLQVGTPDRICVHCSARITRNHNAVIVDCPVCGLYGVMDVASAKRRGWIDS